LGICEEQNLEEEVYKEITDNILLKRAKLCLMHLLQAMDRTEQQLRNKLAQSEYPQEVIDKAIAYVQGFHYLDDKRYAENYVDLRKRTKSRRQIRQELYQKGVPQDIARTAMEDYSPDQEREAIYEWMRKKHFSPDNATPEERKKIYGFLLRKGFRMSDILSCLKMESDTY